MSRKKTQAEFIQEIKDIHKDAITVLGDYKNRDTPIKIRCNNCHREFNMIPYSLINGRGCKYCSNNQRFTVEDIQKEIDYLYGKGKFVVSGKYKNNQTKMKFTYTPTGEYCMQTINHMYDGYNFKYSKKVPLINKHKVKKINTKVKVKHNKLIVTDTASFKKELFKRQGDRFTVIGEYKGMRLPIKVRCNNCGQVMDTQAQILIEYGSCRVCRGLTKSRGETILYSIFKYNNIPFEYQKTIRVPENHHAMYNDFTFTNPKLVIEFDGRQHRDTSMNWYSKEYAERDSYKDKWAKDNGYKMLRLDKLNLAYIKTKLMPYFGDLNIPEKVEMGNYYLPIKQIYNDSFKLQPKDIFLKYGIEENTYRKILKLYK